MEYSNALLNTCVNVINEYNDKNTLYELLEVCKADGLTLYEAELACSALDNYFNGSQTFCKDTYGELSDATPYDLVKHLQDLMKDDTRNDNDLYIQISCIDRWGIDMGDMSNAHYFDPLHMKIRQGNALAVVEDMKGWKESNLAPCTYETIIKGKANNSKERVVFDNFEYILTCGHTSITLFKKLTEEEKEEWDDLG